MYDFVDVTSEDLNRLKGFSSKIDKLIEICQNEWLGNTSRIGSFKIELNSEGTLSISFSPRFHFLNSDKLNDIIEIINDDSELEKFITANFKSTGVNNEKQ